MDVMGSGEIKELWQDKFRQLEQKYRHVLPATFFLIGFLYDALTLDRIDHWFGITQLGVFLFLSSALLLIIALEKQKDFPLFSRWQFLFEYKSHALHFMFGGLLSAFTIFFFKSASLFSSFIFLLLLCSLLIMNELPYFQRMGVRVKSALLALCYLAYFSYTIPIAIGFIGPLPFFLSVFAAWLAMSLVFSPLVIYRLPKKEIINGFVAPALAVSLLFILLYGLKLTPPVPLSAQYMAVYHDIKKENGSYLAMHEKPWWRFWHNADETFLYQDGDRVYCFVRLFSPTDFRDKVRFHWQYHDTHRGWLTADRIPVEIVGGRAEGFRGFAYKQNMFAGDWRVSLETSDGREISRLYFTVLTSPKKERLFSVHRF